MSGTPGKKLRQTVIDLCKRLIFHIGWIHIEINEKDSHFSRVLCKLRTFYSFVLTDKIIIQQIYIYRTFLFTRKCDKINLPRTEEVFYIKKQLNLLWLILILIRFGSCNANDWNLSRGRVMIVIYAILLACVCRWATGVVFNHVHKPDSKPPPPKHTRYHRKTWNNFLPLNLSQNAATCCKKWILTALWRCLLYFFFVFLTKNCSVFNNIDLDYYSSYKYLIFP